MCITIVKWYNDATCTVNTNLFYQVCVAMAIFHATHHGYKHGEEQNEIIQCITWLLRTTQQHIQY